MKTTLEIPDATLRRAKSRAAERVIPMRQFITEAIEEKLKAPTNGKAQPWIRNLGKLKHLRKETRRVSKLIEETFEKVHPEI